VALAFPVPFVPTGAFSLPVIKRGSCNERNYVRKAVNWALLGIGKRNMALNKAALP